MIRQPKQIQKDGGKTSSMTKSIILKPNTFRILISELNFSCKRKSSIFNFLKGVLFNPLKVRGFKK
jgi:hypothetical protein